MSAQNLKHGVYGGLAGGVVCPAAGCSGCLKQSHGF